MQSIILASQSPRRKPLLELANINFEVFVSNILEDYPNDLPIEEVPIYIAKAKAKAVKDMLPNNKKPILAADTIVVIDNEILGKPKNREDAFEILSKLNGQKHKVITGVVILDDSLETFFAETTIVEFYQLTEEQLWFYIDTFKPFDKAGAYAIQEWIGAVGIKGIIGDFYNVMGLPIAKTLNVLKKYMKN